MKTSGKFYTWMAGHERYTDILAPGISLGAAGFSW